ncbi:hypothetical protein FKM82_020976 [Ascaphus truei]
MRTSFDSLSKPHRQSEAAASYALRFLREVSSGMRPSLRIGGEASINNCHSILQPPREMPTERPPLPTLQSITLSRTYPLQVCSLY